jgi:hypothetical protein
MQVLEIRHAILIGTDRLAVDQEARDREAPRRIQIGGAFFDLNGPPRIGAAASVHRMGSSIALAS